MPLTHPAPVLLIACLAWLTIHRAFLRKEGRQRAFAATAVIVSVIFVIAFAAVVIWYTLQPAYFDPAEPTITAVTTVFAYGKPLYPALDAPERYAHVYGPDLFIAHAAAMSAFGGRVIVSKGVGAVAVLASLFLSFGAFRRVAERPAGVIAIGACSVGCLAFGNAAFWTRAEPLLILCAAAALYGAASKTRALSIAAIAIAAGVSWNLKFSGPLYVLPPFVLLMTDARRRRDRHLLAVIGVLAGALAMAPFLVSTISAAHYLQYIELSARNGLLAARLRQNLEWAVVLTAPLVAGIVSARRGGSTGNVDSFVIGLAISIIVIVIIAAKPGAGPYHLLPLIPVIAFAVLRLPVAARRSALTLTMIAGVMTTGCVFAIPRQRTLIQTVRGNEVAQARADVVAFLDAHPSASVGVGYAGTSRWSEARVEAVFRTHDYWLDASAIQEHRLAGLAIPASVMRSLDACRTRYWLMPLGADPFAVPSAYWPGAGPPSVFPDDFRQAFLRSYARVGETRYFGIWECLRDRPVSGERSASPGAREATAR